MRFAFKTAPQNTTWAQMLAVWQEADGIELFESGWLFHHFYPIAGDPAGPCLEGRTALAALAVLANMAAAIDVISGGRLELGIGAGWNVEESGAYGIELGTPRERSDRFEEACQVLIGLLSQEAADFSGRYYQLAGARNEPKGPQRPHPPIVVGGSGERRTLRTAARYAQHWNFVGGTPEEFARKRDGLHAHCQEAGRDPTEITLSSHIRLEGSDVAAAAASVAAFAEQGLDLAIVYLRPPLSPAILAPLADALGQL